MGGGAHAGLAFEVPGYSGALREKSRQLSGVDQGCLYLAVVPSSAPSIPFEIVTKREFCNWTDATLTPRFRCQRQPNRGPKHCSDVLWSDFSGSSTLYQTPSK